MCRSGRGLSKKYLLAKIGFETTEKEPSKAWRRILRYCLPAGGYWNSGILAPPPELTTLNLLACRKMHYRKRDCTCMYFHNRRMHSTTYEYIFNKRCKSPSLGTSGTRALLTTKCVFSATELAHLLDSLRRKSIPWRKERTAGHGSWSG